MGQINHFCSYFQYFDTLFTRGHGTLVHGHGYGYGVVRGAYSKYLHDLVWSFMTLVLVVVACSIAVFVFSPEGVFIPVVSPLPGVDPLAKKARK